MHGILRLTLFGFMPLIAGIAQDAVHTSTITLSAGGETPTANDFGEGSGPVFNGNYEYRVWKHVAVEAGADTMLPAKTDYLFVDILPGTNLIGVTTLQTNSPYVLTERGRTWVTLLPFGLKGILPLAGGRLELFAGLGGAYALHSHDSCCNAMLMRASVGGRFALDKRRHYWLGTSGQFSSNVGGYRQEWLSWTADFGLRFGH